MDKGDCYRIEIATLNPISIDLTSIPPETDYDLYLYDLQQRDPLTYSVEIGEDHISSYQPPHTGIYIIYVYAFEGYSTIPYTLCAIFE